MFGTKIKYLPKRPGERYASALTNMNLSNKVYKYFGKTDLTDVPATMWYGVNGIY